MADVSEQTYESTFSVGDHAELTLRNVRGGIEISGWERPEVSVVAVKKMGTEWGARESFDDTVIEMEHDGPRVRVRTHRSGGGGMLSWMGIGRTPPQVFYTIKVPATSAVSVRTVNGPLGISSVIGALYLRTVEGDIVIKRVSGQIITSSVDATIHGSEIGGTVATKTISGKVDLSQSQLTSFWAKSVSGDVRLETVIDPNGTYESSSVDGSFHLLVPPDSRATAEMTSVSGRASCDLICKVTEQRRGHWQALVNGGGAAISLKTVSGDLTISASSSLPGAAASAPQPTSAPAPANRDWPEMDILKSVERGEMTVEAAIARLAELDKGS